MEKSTKFSTLFCVTVAAVVAAIAILLFIVGVEFKLYFTCFLIASVLFLIGEEFKLVFNSKKNKLLSCLGIILIAVTFMVAVYSIFMVVLMK